MPKGIVYCLTNPEMPELVKIGLVGSNEQGALKRRMGELYNTSGVPVPFELHYAVLVEDEKQTETLLHQTFANHRVSNRREFFRIAPERVVAAMKLTRGEEITLDLDGSAVQQSEEVQTSDIEALKRSRERENKIRSIFRFSEVDILPGSELQFSRDPSMTAKVIDDRHIEFEGNVHKTSPAAKIVLERMGRSGNVAGPDYWMYQGETLTERRRRKEEETEGQPDEE